MQKKIIELKDIELTFFSKKNSVTALKNINLTICEGDFISIVGPSGCGKTTLLSIISGLMRPTLGSIYYDGVLTTEIKPDFYLSKKKIKQHTAKPPKNFFGYMFQKDLLLDWRSVKDNALIGLEIQKCKTKENIAYVMGLLEKYGLGEFIHSYPRELSGGMRQRVALIRTLSLKPKVLLLDEAFSALDYQTRLSVCSDVAKAIKEENKTAILVTHDLEEAISLASKVVVLTKRPGSVQKIIETHFDPSLTPLERRDEIKISQWQKDIWGDNANENE